MNLKNLFLVTDIFKFLKLVKMKIFLNGGLYNQE